MARLKKYKIAIALGLLHATYAGAAAPGDIKTFDISSSGISTAINQLEQESGVTIHSPAISQFQTQPLKGRMSVKSALDQLLNGSGYYAQWQGNEATVISTGAGNSGELLSTVRVSGVKNDANNSVLTGTVPVGANGSSDATASEGTRSYAAVRTTMGGKIALKPQEVTQSVSTITKQRMQDQQLDTLTDVLKQTAGVTVLQNSNNNQFAPNYYSRGYLIRNFQIDGGAPISYQGDNNYQTSFTPVFDMSMYDHVDVLRGADGVNTGVGDPGGTLSLQRKRPTNKPMLNLETSYGSWDHRRLSLDASSPLALDDRLKARTVLTHDDTDYFYKTAFARKNMAYLNIEFDATDRTRFNIGGNYTELTGIPWSTGLPRYSNGNDVDFSRNTCFCFKNSQLQNKDYGFFAQFEHHFNDNWSLNGNFNTDTQHSDSTTGSLMFNDGLDPQTGLAPEFTSVSGNKSKVKSEQYSVDLYTNGQFILFNQPQYVTLGFNYQEQTSHTSDEMTSYSYISNLDVRHFGYPDNFLPGSEEFYPSDTLYPSNQRKQIGGYASFRFSPLEWMHFSYGMRYNRYETRQQTVYSDGTQNNLVFSESKLLPPTTAVSFDLTKDMTFYLSYAGIYQSQAQDRTTDGSILKPVEGNTIEAGLKRSDYNGRLQTSLAIYRTKQNNIAVVDSNSIGTVDPNTGVNCCYFPGGAKNESKGVEFQISGAITPRWQADFSYTYNTNEYQASAEQLEQGSSTGTPLVAQAPKHLFKLFTSYQIANTGVTIGGGGRLQSKTVSPDFISDDEGNVSSINLVQPKYALVDLFTNYRIDKTWSMQFNVNNLFDKKYYESVGGITSGNIYGDPRNYSVTVRASF